MIKLCALFAVLAVTNGCQDTYFVQPTSAQTTQQATTTPTNPTNQLFRTTIEYRVSGNIGLATIRYGNTLDGTSQLTTNLPFSTTLQVNAATVFLSLDVASGGGLLVSNPFTSAQIFVNGALFREANSSSSSPVLSISGTFRN